MTADKATIRLTASSSSADAIGHLERAVKLARELEELGFVVTLSGDIYIDAKVALERPTSIVDLGPNATPEDAARFRSQFERTADD